MYKKLRVATIAPCLNEESKIDEVIRRVNEVGFIDNIVVVDDGSSDRSVQKARDRGAKVLTIGKTLGVGAALRTGFDFARKHADVLIILAGNNKDEPKEMSRLLDPIADDKADFVQGSRFLPGGYYGGDMPSYRKIATRIHPIFFSFFTGKWVTESTNGFRAFRVSLLDDPRIRLDQSWLNAYELEPYLYYKAITLGYDCREVPVTKIYPSRKMGNTKMKPITSWWSILRPLLLLKLGVKR